VIYEPVGDKVRIQVSFADGSTTEQTGNLLDAKLATEIFSRSGRIDLMRVGIPEAVLSKQ
jgi:hypothetical protein